MVPKPAFCSIPHENVVFAVFFAWWVAGAVRNPANSLDLYNQPSENVLFCNVSASTSWSSAAAPSSISVSHNHIILNLLLRVFSLGTGLLISVYIFCLSNFLLECLVFCNLSNLKFSLFFSAYVLQIYVAYYQLISSHPTSCIAVCWETGWPRPLPTGPTHSTGWGGGLPLFNCILNISLHILLCPPLSYLI